MQQFTCGKKLLNFYETVEAPPTTPIYERVEHGGNNNMPFTTWRYKLRDFSAAPPHNCASQKRPRSAPTSPQGKGLLNDDALENGIVNLQLLKKRLLQQDVAKASPRQQPPKRRLFHREKQSPPLSSLLPHRPMHSFLAAMLDKELDAEALTQNEEECELSPEEIADLYDREEKAVQL